MTSQEELYLSFLAFSLSDNAAPPDGLEGMDWAGLLRFAEKQALVGTVFEGVRKIPATGGKPPERFIMRWAAKARNIQQRNAKVDQAVAGLSRWLKRKDISFFVFKGQTVARCYPQPSSRTSGDIDFYVYQKDRQKACRLLADKVHVAYRQGDKHCQFFVDGIEYEMHFSTADFYARRHQRYWDRVIDAAQTTEVDICGTGVPTLTPTLNAAYLFVHIFHHFILGGIGLRQLCDWRVFIERNCRLIDGSLFRETMSRIGLTKACRAFGCILTDRLGLDEACFPYELSARDRRWEGDILDTILKEGNFGRGVKKAKGGMQTTIEIGLIAARHIAKFYGLAPEENLRLLPRLIFKHMG